jgi:hypothetical protein
MPTRTRRLALLIALTVAALSGCRETTSVSIPEIPISATATPKAIVVRNLTPFTMYYGAVESGVLAAFNSIGPFGTGCDASGTCPAIPPNGGVVLPWNQVMGFDVRRTGYVVQWSLARRPERGAVFVSTVGVTLEP